MSPEVSIEPVDFVLCEHGSQFVADAVLPEAPHREGNGFTDGGPELVGEPFELVVGRPVDSHTGALHTI